MKKNNKKGFTLIELLAVIIVLALILVFAIPAVLDTSTKAQKKAFATYARRVLTLANEYVEAKKLDGAVSSFAFKNGEGESFSLGSNDNEYAVCIEYSNNGTEETYKIYMHNDTYYIGSIRTPYSGVTEEDLKNISVVNSMSNVDSLSYTTSSNSSLCTIEATISGR